ncbi:MAG: hypothetical protein ABW007_09860 [Chitinophagaceae bacterium]
MSNQVAERSVEQTGKQQPQELMWADLIIRFIKVLKAKGKGGQEGNFKTAFKYFLISIGVTEESPVGPEFGDDEFEAKVKIYIEFEVGRKLKESTYGPRISKIRELKRFAEANFAEILRLQTLPKTFGQKLIKLITSLGFTMLSFWRTLPKGVVGYNSLVSWCRDRSYPSSEYLAAVKTIETCLLAPEGTLRLSKYLYVGLPLTVGQTDVSNKMMAALGKPYYAWTPPLEEEFQKLFNHKTVAILPEGEERHHYGQWTSSEGAGVPSADVVQQYLRSFMGFCVLPEDNPDPYLRGQGIKREELSLALLADKELVEAYLRFRKLRSGLRIKPLTESKTALPTHLISSDGKWEYYDKGGKYNRGSIQTLVYISSLLRPAKGYLYQHPEFAEKLGSRMTGASWQEQCAATCTRSYP